MIKSGNSKKSHYDYFGDNFGNRDSNDDIDGVDLSFRAPNEGSINPETHPPLTSARRLD
jgi:hypothetical protein